MTYRERKEKQKAANGAEGNKETLPAKKTEPVVNTSAAVETKKDPEETPPVVIVSAKNNHKKKLREHEVHTGFTVDRDLLHDFTNEARQKGRMNKYLLESFMISFVFSPKETMDFIEKNVSDSEK